MAKKILQHQHKRQAAQEVKISEHCVFYGGCYNKYVEVTFYLMGTVLYRSSEPLHCVYAQTYN